MVEDDVYVAFSHFTIKIHSTQMLAPFFAHTRYRNPRAVSADAGECVVLQYPHTLGDGPHMLHNTVKNTHTHTAMCCVGVEGGDGGGRGGKREEREAKRMSK
jgi:hypothetical protein